MKLRATLFASVAALGLSSAAAYAVPVSGQISLGGYAQAAGSTGMGGATGISFANAAGSGMSGSSGTLTSFGAGSGSFAALGACSSTTTGCGTIKNISSFASTPAISSFLTLTNGSGATVTFDLSSITSVVHAQDSTGGSLTFTANGMINFTGYDATAGQFILTAQGNNIVSFSATTLSTAIPEPMSLALLGGSLAAVGLIRRKKSVEA